MNGRKFYSIFLFTFLIFLLCSCRRCQYIDVPPPTDKPVPTKDILGTWYYHTVGGRTASVTIKEDGTYEQCLDIASKDTSIQNRSKWKLEGANISFYNFRYSHAAPDFPWPTDKLKDLPTTFYITTWYTKGFAPYGGDGDPDVFEIWRRSK